MIVQSNTGEEGRFIQPFVTIIMPIRNEAVYIRRSLGAVLAQDYPPDRMEVLVVDGMSGDGTRETVKELASVHRHTSVRVLDNPARIVPTALNIGLRHASGEVIIRVDGHCEIASDYVRQCVHYLAQTGVACVGGPIETVGQTFVAQAIALAMSSPFGVGNTYFRTLRQERYVDTVAFGAYRREVFEQVGLFDEELVRNQDDEFNFRLTQVGGRILMTPAIRSIYYSRATLHGQWKQYFEYGFWKVRLIQKRGAVPSWRHLIPATFVLGLLVTLLLALLTGQPLWALLVAGPYAVASVIATLWTAVRDWKTLPLLPLAFLTLHLSYGIGFLWGLWKWRKKWHKKQVVVRYEGLGQKETARAP